ncbi:GntR family transcriptional regulator [Companilactobacillus zhachilii]|uniref:GntR family transcriptional regulator n=1 Tax=Companilactobacillus zhachilii TaxID=2304606 RepID=UPI001920D919|nr:GntR family transcriptional regulator [Companilactobacillus zhachilii]MBL3530796.1 GntR family transcriptional regulator [Companilactobacillus zhachilii]
MGSGNLPKHTIIENDLLSKIKNGVYQPETLIPKETELMQIYGVSRPTVRQAIQSLVDKGLLAKRKKRGTIVLQNKISQEFTHIIESYDDEVKNKGLTPKTHVILLQKELPTKDIYDNLQIAKDDYVFKLVRLRYANDQPIVLVTSYIPFKFFPTLDKFDFEKVSLYPTLDDNNCHINQVRRKLEVLSADETTADLLNIDENAPIFYFHTIGYTKDNVPMEYSIAKYRGDINSFEIYLKR